MGLPMSITPEGHPHSNFRAGTVCLCCEQVYQTPLVLSIVCSRWDATETGVAPTNSNIQRRRMGSEIVVEAVRG